MPSTFTVVEQAPAATLYWIVQAPEVPADVFGMLPPAMTEMLSGKPPCMSTPRVTAGTSPTPQVCRAAPEAALAVLAAKLTAEPPSTAPFQPPHAAVRALALMLKYLGNATAARMPRIAITTTSSMIVKPLVLLTLA